ncbi:unnamed protein product [marine sediment metagenome]|uniref:Metal-binding protein n=1 Tax=marine sediment metagenome TaxID=412755 RepID=X1I648_9ZZZZ
MNEKTECAKCTRVVCNSEAFLKGPSNCPTKTKKELIQQALTEYDDPQTREFARQASIQEFECYMHLPEGLTTRYPRVEEIVQFAKKMGFKKLGIAFCGGLADEAKMLTRILENRGFEVVSVCCKAGAIPKERIGITEEQKIAGAGAFEAMCSPITQAEILNDEGAEFNILVGLCVGHDSLFFKYSKAPVTVLVAKDRVFGHNPVMGLYLASSYYRKLLRKESLDS